MINLSAAKPNPIPFVFVSSISSTTNWAAISPTQKALEPVPETFIDDCRAAEPTGYAESKYVAEAILHAAAMDASVPVSVLRVGQVAGSSAANGGSWNEREWFPALIRTSRNLGKLPANLPPVDWVPVDVVASVICEAAFSAASASRLMSSAASAAPCNFYNIVNPSPVAYAEILPHILSALQPQPETVPLDDWIEELERMDGANADTGGKFPAVKILHFYRSLLRPGEGHLRFETKQAARLSKEFAALQPVQSEQVSRWIKEMK